MKFHDSSTIRDILHLHSICSAKFSRVITTTGRKMPVLYSSLFSFFHSFSLFVSHTACISHAAVHMIIRQVWRSRKPSVLEEVTSACQVNWTVSASNRRGGRTGWRRGPCYAIINGQSLELETDRWCLEKSSRRERSRHENSSDPCCSVPHEFHLCTFVWVIRRVVRVYT